MIADYTPAQRETLKWPALTSMATNKMCVYSKLYVEKCVRRDSTVLFVKYLRVWAIFTLIKDAILLLIHYFPLNFLLVFSLCIFPVAGSPHILGSFQMIIVTQFLITWGGGSGIKGPSSTAE